MITFCKICNIIHRKRRALHPRARAVAASDATSRPNPHRMGQLPFSRDEPALVYRARRARACTRCETIEKRPIDVVPSNPDAHARDARRVTLAFGQFEVDLP